MVRGKTKSKSQSYRALSSLYYMSIRKFLIHPLALFFILYKTRISGHSCSLNFRRGSGWGIYFLPLSSLNLEWSVHCTAVCLLPCISCQSNISKFCLFATFCQLLVLVFCLSVTGNFQSPYFFLQIQYFVFWNKLELNI